MTEAGQQPSPVSTQDLIAYVTRVHARTLEAVEAIPADRLGWRPRPGEFSMGEVALHIANSRLMNVSSIQGKPPHYRGHELAEGTTLDDLRQAMLQSSKTTVARLSDADLSAEVAGASGNRSPAWMILIGGLIEHEVHHRSQLCDYLAAAGVAPPALYGLHVEDLPT